MPIRRLTVPLRALSRVGLAALLVLLWPLAPAQAADDEVAIRSVMLATWDRPEARLAVDPVVVRDGHAVAGWTQGDAGGRALLRRDKTGAWVVWLCSGDSLKSADTLTATGVPHPLAHDLAAALAKAEGALPPERVARFGRFEGTVMVQGAEEHGNSHGAHAAPPPHPK